MTLEKEVREIISSIIWQAVQESYATIDLRDNEDRIKARQQIYEQAENQATTKICELAIKLADNTAKLKDEIITAQEKKLDKSEKKKERYREALTEIIEISRTLKGAKYIAKTALERKD